MAEVNLDRLQSWVDQGRLNPSRPITMIELYKSGCVSSIRDGIKLLSRVGSSFIFTTREIERERDLTNVQTGK
jgi:large subunit ribosomal protein L15